MILGAIPTSENVLPVTPYLFGGYSVLIDKDNAQEYCINCIYKIIFEADADVNDLYLVVRMSNWLTILTANTPQFGITQAGKRTCFLYYLPKEDKDENIIVSSNVNTGNASLYINPWSLPNNKRDFPIIYNVYDIEVIRLYPYMRDIISQSFGNIYLCIYAEKISSYFLNVFLEKDIEKNQYLNTLVAGTLLNYS